ncbi:MAG: hypothetical protein EKK65_02050, partial [Lysobacterales bacterium]
MRRQRAPQPGQIAAARQFGADGGEPQRLFAPEFGDCARHRQREQPSPARPVPAARGAAGGEIARKLGVQGRRTGEAHGAGIGSRRCIARYGSTQLGRQPHAGRGGERAGRGPAHDDAPHQHDRVAFGLRPVGEFQRRAQRRGVRRIAAQPQPADRRAAYCRRRRVHEALVETRNA